MSAGEAVIQSIPIGNLVENDYNPRKRFDDAAMEDLKNSIENVGLVQPPTARPLDNGDYEVISGVRRLRALRDVYDEDHEVPVHVRDVDDEQARWMALAENLDRMDLTPIEEARAYAQHVTIEAGGEQMQYDEYIKEVQNEILVPSHSQGSVQTLAGKINPNAPTIERRLELLVLPDKVQNKVEVGELALEAAHVIARLRQVPDTEYREKHMKRLAERHSGTNPDLDALRDSVDGFIEDYQEEQDRQQARIERLESLVDERKTKLRAELNQAAEAFEDATGETLDVENGDDLNDLAQDAVNQLRSEIDSLGTDRIDELDDREAEVRREMERIERNVSVIRDEGLARCPYCKAGVHADDLEDRIESHRAEIQSIKEEKGEINDKRETLRDIRSDLRQALTQYTDATEELEEAREEVT